MNRGFTLMELLVVIAIIGILSSIILVAFQDSQSRHKYQYEVCQPSGESSDCYYTDDMVVDSNKCAVLNNALEEGETIGSITLCGTYTVKDQN